MLRLGQWSDEREEAYRLLLAYAELEQECHNPTLGGDSHRVELRTRALAAAKEAE